MDCVPECSYLGPICMPGICSSFGRNEADGNDASSLLMLVVVRMSWKECHRDRVGARLG